MAQPQVEQLFREYIANDAAKAGWVKNVRTKYPGKIDAALAKRRKNLEQEMANVLLSNAALSKGMPSRWYNQQQRTKLGGDLNAMEAGLERILQSHIDQKVAEHKARHPNSKGLSKKLLLLKTKHRVQKASLKRALRGMQSAMLKYNQVNQHLSQGEWCVPFDKAESVDKFRALGANANGNSARANELRGFLDAAYTQNKQRVMSGQDLLTPRDFLGQIAQQQAVQNLIAVKQDEDENNVDMDRQAAAALDAKRAQLKAELAAVERARKQGKGGKGLNSRGL